MKLLLTLFGALALSGCSSLQIGQIPPDQGLQCDVGTATNVLSTATFFVRRNCEFVPRRRVPA